jgi:hypothetical protein
MSALYSSRHQATAMNKGYIRDKAYETAVENGSITNFYGMPGSF